MKDKFNNFKQKFKEWWEAHKKPVKIGFWAFVIGALYGFAKGALTESKILGSAYDRLPQSDDDGDELGLTEENCDDPDLLETVNNENENS